MEKAKRNRAEQMGISEDAMHLYDPGDIRNPFPLPFKLGDLVRLDPPYWEEPLYGVLGVYDALGRYINMAYMKGLQLCWISLTYWDIDLTNGWPVIHWLHHTVPSELPAGQGLLVDLSSYLHHLADQDSEAAKKLFLDLYDVMILHEPVPVTVDELLHSLRAGRRPQMDNQHIEELAAMVPSETVRQYILETGWTFTDMERAALLHHSDLPLEQKDSCLRDLQTRTEDERLRKQLSEYLSQEGPFNEERDDYFTYIFYEVPNPFERGDIVRLVDTEEYGVVETSQRQWQETLARYQSDEWKPTGLGPDYSDVQIRVGILDNDGTFGHAHINPIDLERYQPKGGWTDGSPMDKLLLCASDLYQGKGSLDELYFFTMGYRKDREQH